MIYYLLIGIGFTFMIEMTSNYAEVILNEDDDEVSKTLTIVERLTMIVFWPIILLMFLYYLNKKG
jgi:cell shape-determining protein MreD